MYWYADASWDTTGPCFHVPPYICQPRAHHESSILSGVGHHGQECWSTSHPALGHCPYTCVD
eukprot:2257716-Pyramimonas_sp.AAC.1